ncbi:MAG: cytochrome c1 [Gammaproteobacteria bacterium]|nr:cytochrome c1 [Gammaproteobacteria bacterium]MDE2262393.1 cytochrome c1 [Gammaproteobacteria bacterium]
MPISTPFKKVPALLLAVALVAGAAGAARAFAADDAPSDADWQSWTANANVTDTASLQRGARDFVGYCLGCHSLKYERWSRLAQDLHIPEALLVKDLIPPGETPAGYIISPMIESDAEKWFGKAPPDLSLMARARGNDYLYQYLKTFYVDSARATGANNMAFPQSAMPDIVAPLEGLKVAVYKNVGTRGADGQMATEQVFDHFKQIAPGSMTPQQFDQFVHDVVNFLDYVGDPQRAMRHAMGVWVVLFLLVFTWLAWLLKREFWKDVK